MSEIQADIEIWSDIMCPFCYIGKRKFEKAMEQFHAPNDLKIVWKSYQLSPHLVTDTNKSLNEYLAEHKGVGIAQAKSMNDRVSEMAADVGLVYNLDKAIPANSFKAHQFLHFALEKNVQMQAEEKLFAAYFTDCKNIDDLQVLLEIGASLGLEVSELRAALEQEIFAGAVHQDIEEAMQIGVRGVPFFVFNRKYAVSGAQPVEVFLQTLNTAFQLQ